MQNCYKMVPKNVYLLYIFNLLQAYLYKNLYKLKIIWIENCSKIEKKSVVNLFIDELYIYVPKRVINIDNLIKMKNTNF
jgi:hypothetical protein